MALFLQHKTDAVHWAVWKMEESLEVLLSLLPDARRTSCERELARFSSEQRRTEWLSVRVLLYSMLPEDKEIGYTSEGKPYLADHSFHISISHTQGYAAVILATQASVGIDIERYGQRVHRVTGRFVRPDEHVGFYQGDDTWGLLLHWSAKESVFKCMRTPDADLRKIRLLPFVPQREGQFQVRTEETAQEEMFDVHYRICPDFVLTWTVVGSNLCQSV